MTIRERISRTKERARRGVNKAREYHNRFQSGVEKARTEVGKIKADFNISMAETQADVQASLGDIDFGGLGGGGGDSFTGGLEGIGGGSMDLTGGLMGQSEPTKSHSRRSKKKRR